MNIANVKLVGLDFEGNELKLYEGKSIEYATELAYEYVDVESERKAVLLDSQGVTEIHSIADSLIELSEHNDSGVNKYSGELTLANYSRIQDCSPVVTNNARIAYYLNNSDNYKDCRVTLIEEDDCIKRTANVLLDMYYGISTVMSITQK